jgi:hypothetical protein
MLTTVPVGTLEPPDGDVETIEPEGTELEHACD